jgi:hypothetical protein
MSVSGNLSLNSGPLDGITCQLAGGVECDVIFWDHGVIIGAKVVVGMFNRGLFAQYGGLKSSLDE